MINIMVCPSTFVLASSVCIRAADFNLESLGMSQSSGELPTSRIRLLNTQCIYIHLQIFNMFNVIPISHTYKSKLPTFGNKLLLNSGERGCSSKWHKYHKWHTIPRKFTACPMEPTWCLGRRSSCLSFCVYSSDFFRGELVKLWGWYLEDHPS